MRMAPDFEKANEIYFRLGIIYKQQGKYTNSLEASRTAGPPSRSRKMLTVRIVLQVHRIRSSQATH
jgi:hypothetical protein